MDIIISIPTVIIAAPIVLFAAFLISLLSGSYPFFLQERPGYLGKPFTLYKLRTMFKKGEFRNYRILNNIGKLLRTFSIDELPQFLNVLKGDMSVVGPRPLLIGYLPLYNPFQRQRHNVKPGITGWAQINGRNGLIWQKRFELDVWYTKNHSLTLDFYIIVKTIMELLRPKNVKPSGLKDHEKFKGNKVDSC
ncbi:sugar transferase [Catalinimonas sp. 4WD22]|uniref:sugar transferase n=1 Tax=Catalinimonas locisalis TaxID=3133978 RepID=UPI003100E10F